MWAAFLSENRSRLTARSAGRPRTWSATRRAFCGEMRAVRRTALASIVISLPGLPVAAVTLERAGQGELTELVADHVLVDQHRDVVAAVMHGDRVALHFRQDHRAARPGLDRTLARARGLHLLEQVVVNEGTFLEGTWHGRSAPAVAHDELLGARVVTRLVTLGGHAPWRDRVRVALPGLALAAAVRMVDGVHGRAAHGRLDAAPALGTGLAQLLQVVLDVADLTDGGAALGRHAAHLARAQAQRGVGALAGHQLHAGAGGAGHLRALAGLHLDAVHRRTHGDVAQRQGVAHLDRRIGTGHHLVAGLQALGRNDVAALAVNVDKQGDVGGAVGIVFDPLHARRDAFLVALEIDNAVVLLVATADVAGGDAPVVVAATGAALLLQQRRVRFALVQLGRDHADRGAAAGGGGLEFHQWHGTGSCLSGVLIGSGLRQTLAVITSIAWPSARVTYALRQSPRRPVRKRKDLFLPFTLTTFTACTWTSKSFSTAALMSALVASLATSNAYWLETSCRRAVFSDTRGARITS